ncbi:hypothetical protein EXE59_23445 [Nocardioides eburneiflavus]|uniref:Putative Flp pilus-assembly TadG-like N-terminal domain-containing protein n=1 Tax=Nocardioides eburneiflavus TaxID=2518372 RepID=A0A4Z1C082_9ACTN|nr:hypothetical protein EXE59_23445 [Nocardioides eburneiflavus]
MSALRARRSGEPDETGAVAIVVALLAVVMFGCAALAVDISSLAMERQRLHDHVDSAAHAGAFELPASGTSAKTWAVTMAKTQDAGMTPDTELFCVVASTGASRQVASGQIPATCDPGTYSSSQVRCNTKICSIPVPRHRPVQHHHGERLQGRRLRLRAGDRARRGLDRLGVVVGVPGLVRRDPAQPDGHRLHGRPHHQHGRGRPRGHAGRDHRQPGGDGPDPALRRVRGDAQEQGHLVVCHGGHDRLGRAQGRQVDRDRLQQRLQGQPRRADQLEQQARHGRQVHAERCRARPVHRQLRHPPRLGPQGGLALPARPRPQQPRVVAQAPGDGEEGADLRDRRSARRAPRGGQHVDHELGRHRGRAQLLRQRQGQEGLRQPDRGGRAGQGARRHVLVIGFGDARSASCEKPGGRTPRSPWVRDYLAAAASPTPSGTPSKADSDCSTSAERVAENKDGDYFYCAASGTELGPIFATAVNAVTESIKLIQMP